MLTTDPDHLVALPPGTARLALIHDASPIMPVSACLISLADLNTLLEHLLALDSPAIGHRLHQLMVAHHGAEDDTMHSLDLSLTAAEIDHVVAWVTTRRCG